MLHSGHSMPIALRTIKRGALADLHYAHCVDSAVALRNLVKIVILFTSRFGDGAHCNLHCATRGIDLTICAHDLMLVRRFICLGLSPSRNRHIHETSFGVAWLLPRLISAFL